MKKAVNMIEDVNANSQRKRSRAAAHPARLVNQSDDQWSAVTKVRLPHKIGLPLGCGGDGVSQ
jgi:hypothetical protein